jgi:hypothetical protein
MKSSTNWAEVYLNEDYFEIITCSMGMIGYPEPEAEPYYLAPYADNATLGNAVRKALSASKRLTVEEFQKLFSSGVIQRLIEDRTNAVMQKYGYKTKRAMCKNMNNCSIDMVDGKIRIQPMHHKTVDGYSATKGGPAPLSIDATASDAELGDALREGFKRCTSALA